MLVILTPRSHLYSSQTDSGAVAETTPLSVSPVRCKGPSQGGYLSCRAVNMWQKKQTKTCVSMNNELLRLRFIVASSGVETKGGSCYLNLSVSSVLGCACQPQYCPLILVVGRVKMC